MSLKRMALTVVVLFVVWAVLDYVLHGLLLAATYAATPELWRPMEEMNVPLMYATSLVFAVCFVLLYRLVGKKSPVAGMQFGALLGLGVGFSMGFGSYTVMLIPPVLAWAWFLGTLVEMTVAGAIAGWLLKD